LHQVDDLAATIANLAYTWLAEHSRELYEAGRDSAFDEIREAMRTSVTPPDARRLIDRLAEREVRVPSDLLTRVLGEPGLEPEPDKVSIPAG
jgi:hypothetical protein